MKYLKAEYYKRDVLNFFRRECAIQVGHPVNEDDDKANDKLVYFSLVFKDSSGGDIELEGNSVDAARYLCTLLGYEYGESATRYFDEAKQDFMRGLGLLEKQEIELNK